MIKIRWEAEGELSAGDLNALAGLGKNRILRVADFETTIRRVLGALQARGFYFAQIDSVVSEATTRLNTVEARVYLGSNVKVQFAPVVKITDSTAYFSVSRENPNNWRGKIDEEKLLQCLTERLEDFAKRGYPLACFYIDSVVMAANENDEALAKLYLQFDPGPAVRIDSIVVRGNKLTKRSVLARELPVRVGDSFNFDKVQSIPDRLMRLGYLQSVAPPQLALDTRGRYLLDIAIVEGNSNWLNGVAGYNPGEGTQKGFVSGLIDVKFGNLLGTGRQINARWEKRSRQTQELALRYREPWVLGYPVHLAGGFQQLIQDTTYVERRWEFAAELPVGQNFTASGHVAKESISPDSLARIRFNLPHSSVISVGATLRYDSTDDPINPRRGVFYTTTVETGRKTTDQVIGVEGKKFSRDKILVDLHWLLPTLGPQVLSLAVHGRQVKSNAPPEILVTDQFRFGGATTLRGYREEQFRGSRVAWSNVEYRHLLSRRTRAFLFFDAGYYSGFEYVNAISPQLNQVENNVYAWGFGARIDTPLGIVGVDYGLGEGDALTNGKVHVSLVNSF
ncbi:BamA/TamA family outer membrane protein [candidate division KSB1 bacterium]|nr:BamA/TamA family outer membrane protein [candidate division KSB1 bacterium]